MKQKEIFKKIGGIIKELSDQYEYLKTTADSLNDLELELFAANTHFLVDHIEVLCKLNLQNQEEKPVAEKTDLIEPTEKTVKFNKPEKLEKPIKQEAPRKEKYFEPVVQQMKHHTEKVIDKKVKEPIDEAEKIKPVPEKLFEEAEKPIAEIEKPVEETEKPFEEATKEIEFEIVANNNNDEYVVPGIDLVTENKEDSYSFIREEPEMIRHELVLDEAMDFDEDEYEKPEPVNKLKSEPVAEVIPDVKETLPIVEEVIPDFEKPLSIFEEAAPVVEEPLSIFVEAAPVVEEPETVVEETIPERTAIKPAEVEQESVPLPKQEEEVLTINQRMYSQLGDKGIGRTEQLAVKPISDIKLAITLNDKLLYVKDLFNGYNLAYSEAIEILNRFNTFEEASRFLNANYVTKNNWESKPVTTAKFYALLKRRYA